VIRGEGKTEKVSGEVEVLGRANARKNGWEDESGQFQRKGSRGRVRLAGKRPTTEGKTRGKKEERARQGEKK